METITITMHPENPAQMEAVKAFFKALKIKHTIKTEHVKMSKKEYFEMLQNSANDALLGEKHEYNQKLKEELFGL